jgi:hypothetical protein
MAMVLSDDFILFQIPAFHHSIFAAGEQVGMTGRNCKTSDGRDVAC